MGGGREKIIIAPLVAMVVGSLVLLVATASDDHNHDHRGDAHIDGSDLQRRCHGDKYNRNQNEAVANCIEFFKEDLKSGNYLIDPSFRYDEFLCPGDIPQVYYQVKCIDGVSDEESKQFTISAGQLMDQYCSNSIGVDVRNDQCEARYELYHF